MGSNIGLIFAAGNGTRMHNDVPKQYMEVSGKPIIIHTLDVFQNSQCIDEIIVVCAPEWKKRLNEMIVRFDITKVTQIVDGGMTSHNSIYNGLRAAMTRNNFSKEDIVLIHDGVRPVMDEDTLIKNIDSVKRYGNAITSSPAIETVFLSNDGETVDMLADRNMCFKARAPQSFKLEEIFEIYENAKKKGIISVIDSATLCSMSGMKMHIVLGPADNIKITTYSDYWTFKSIFEEHR